MFPVDLLAKLRQTRALQDVKLKPSPYLRDSFVDEYGENREVKIRNYQAQGIMNLLQMERMILGDDTGLGKTLEMLSAIGYVWMKEPEYVPIIITTKSALFQWESETRKFMQGMEAVTVHREPHRRHAIYESFFLKHDPTKKQLLILTYDHVMYDMTEAVIREKTRSPRKGFAKELEVARAESREAEDLFVGHKDVYEAQFKDRPYDVVAYLDAYFKFPDKRPPAPGMFTEKDKEVLLAFATAQENFQKAKSKLQALRLEASPPKKVPGLIDYVDELQKAHPHIKFMLVMDEMHKLKNHKSQFHEKTASLAAKCQRVYGLTATPVKNRLMEFWALFKIIAPKLFPKITAFQDEFCVTKLQPIGGGRQVRIVVGYRNLERFVELVEPYYLSRKKHDVAKELPELISMEIECELTPLQEELYDLAEVGLLNKSEDPDVSGAELLSSMTMCQQAVDSPCLLVDGDGDQYEGPSSKIDALLELLEGDAQDEKIIVFSKFEKMISLIELALKDKKIKCVRITGKESSSQIREKNKNTFQDMNSGVNVILITTAGSESLNLHSAEHFALMDLPWSWGDYLQLIGRALRIGSHHKTVVAHHFLGKKADDSKTIDHHVLKALRSKKKLADKVAGENLKDGLKFESDSAKDVLAAIRDSRLLLSGGVSPITKPKAKKTARAPVHVEDDVPVKSIDLDSLMDDMT